MKIIQSTVNIRMEQPLKDEAESLFHEMGLTMSSAFNMFVRQVVRLRKIPFEISATHTDPFYSESNMHALRKSIRELERGDVVVKTLDEMKALAK